MREHQLEGKTPLTPVAELRNRNLAILRQLIQKNVEISSNSYQNMKRSYFVEDVREITINVGSGFVPGVCLTNRTEAKETQPQLKFPSDEIEVEELDDNRVQLTLFYSHEPNIRRSFRHFHKPSRPDMVLTITYRKK